jgi:hypothetical protein
VFLGIRSERRLLRHFRDEDSEGLERLSLTKTLCTLIRMSFSQANREAQAVRATA